MNRTVIRDPVGVSRDIIGAKHIVKDVVSWLKDAGIPDIESRPGCWRSTKPQSPKPSALTRVIGGIEMADRIGRSLIRRQQNVAV